MKKILIGIFFLVALVAAAGFSSFWPKTDPLGLPLSAPSKCANGRCALPFGSDVDTYCRKICADVPDTDKKGCQLACATTQKGQ